MKDKTSLKGIHYESGNPVKIDIGDGIIQGISDLSRADIKGTDFYIAPGLIDNQINGYHGVDFSDPDITTGDILKSVKDIQKDGVTSFHPTILTNSHEKLLSIFSKHALLMKNEEIRESVPGLHMESSYLSPETGFFGCHPKEYLRKPSWSEFIQYQKAAEGNIRVVTLAPELDGAIEFIRQCVGNNLLVSIGHSNASASQINLAAENGASLSTHLGNGCANLIDRHNNPIWPQLANDLITPSIIGDGHHLTREEMKVFFRVKGPDKLFLISDVTHLIGMPAGKYNYMGSEVILDTDGLIKNPVLNVLAGASFPLCRGIGNMIRWAGCTLAQAVNLATRNVAVACRLPDRGTLKPGKRADLILFELNDNNVLVRQTWVRGRKVYDS